MAPTAWQKFRYITVPQLGPTTFFVTVMLTIQSFKVFDQIYMITQGGPGTSTLVLVYHIYNEAFISWDLGYSSMVALVLFFLVLAVTVFQFRPQEGGCVTQDRTAPQGASVKIGRDLRHRHRRHAMMLMPFAWMLSASLKLSRDVFAFPIEWIPSEPQWHNYVDIWTKIPLALFIWQHVEDDDHRHAAAAFDLQLCRLRVRQAEFPATRTPCFSATSPPSPCPGRSIWCRNSC